MNSCHCLWPVALLLALGGIRAEAEPLPVPQLRAPSALPPAPDYRQGRPQWTVMLFAGPYLLPYAPYDDMADDYAYRPPLAAPQEGIDWHALPPYRPQGWDQQRYRYGGPLPPARSCGPSSRPC